MEWYTFVLSLIISTMIMIFISWIWCFDGPRTPLCKKISCAHLSSSSSSRRYHKLMLDLGLKSIASSCCHLEIPIEDIFLDMPYWKIIHQYQLKYVLHNFDTNWMSLHKLMPIGMDSCISWFHLGNANKDKR